MHSQVCLREQNLHLIEFYALIYVWRVSMNETKPTTRSESQCSDAMCASIYTQSTNLHTCAFAHLMTTNANACEPVTTASLFFSLQNELFYGKVIALFAIVICYCHSNVTFARKTGATCNCAIRLFAGRTNVTLKWQMNANAILVTEKRLFLPVLLKQRRKKRLK